MTWFSSRAKTTPIGRSSFIFKEIRTQFWLYSTLKPPLASVFTDVRNVLSSTREN